MSVSRKLFQEFIDQTRLSLLAALFAVLVTSAVSAQIVETGVITGVVRDSAGAVVVKAHVTVLNTSTGLASNTITDSQGLYVSPPLDPGNYSVEVEALSFSKDDGVGPELRQRFARVPLDGNDLDEVLHA